MTKSAKNWEDELRDERACNLARRFAIEDLAMTYRTSSRAAEEILTTGAGVPMETSRTAAVTSNTIGRMSEESRASSQYIDNSEKAADWTKIKVEETREDMEVDVEAIEPKVEHSAPPRQANFPMQNGFSARPKRESPFDDAREAAGHVPAYYRHTFPSHTWPYGVTCAQFAKNRSLAHSYPLVYNPAGPGAFLFRGNQFRTTGEQNPGERNWNAVEKGERSQIAMPYEVRPQLARQQGYALYREMPQRVYLYDETPGEIVPAEESLRLMTFKEREDAVRASEERPGVFTFKAEASTVYEGRPRSYTPPKPMTAKGFANVATKKPRRHSDDAVTNYKRPSVIVMRRSSNDPTSPKEQENFEHCSCHDHTDSDSSSTPPLSSEGHTSSGDSKDEKPHKCKICGRAFRKHSALVIHHRVHSGEKPYRCPECSKNFSISGNLRRHFLIHTGERPYVCPECSRAFNNPSHLTRHRRKLHNIKKVTNI